jgi:hypothetical protein
MQARGSQGPLRSGASSKPGEDQQKEDPTERTTEPLTRERTCVDARNPRPCVELGREQPRPPRNGQGTVAGGRKTAPRPENRGLVAPTFQPYT